MQTIITLAQDFDYFQLYKGDQIIVDHEAYPKTGDIVISEFEGDFRPHRFERPNSVASIWPPHDSKRGLDDIIFGVAIKASGVSL